MASDALARGALAFKVGHYDEATRDFQAAVDAEPSWQMARLYLATALSYQVVPNLDTPENLGIAKRAMDQFDVVLQSDPQNWMRCGRSPRFSGTSSDLMMRLRRSGGLSR